MSTNADQFLQKFFSHVESNKSRYIERLREAVAIPSVSAWPENRQHVVKMCEWTAEKLKGLGAQVELVKIGDQTLPDNSKIELPPILFGHLGSDPAKKTLLIYGHLDVQPALKTDGWDTEPFELTEKDDKLYGRGSTDDKGPVLAWLNTIEAYIQLHQTIPVNIKFCLEGMEESGSINLDSELEKRKDTFLHDVDYVTISDSYWLGKNKPCLTYGLRGNVYMFVEVESSTKDLHSGVFGGSVHEAMSDLMYLMSELVDVRGKILIPGIYDSVAELKDSELKLYESIDFNLNEYLEDTGCFKLIHDRKVDTLLHRWRYPSLSIHGVEGAFDGSGAKTVIPRKVIGKFSIRIVPNQTTKEIEEKTKAYLEEKFAKRNSPNKLKVYAYKTSRPWVTPFDHPNYQAAANAIKKGCSIPVTLTLEELTKKSVLLLPIGASDDGAHSQNEKVNIRNYINGIKLLGTYLSELSKL